MYEKAPYEAVFYESFCKLMHQIFCSIAGLAGFQISFPLIRLLSNTEDAHLSHLSVAADVYFLVVRLYNEAAPVSQDPIFCIISGTPCDGIQQLLKEM